MGMLASYSQRNRSMVGDSLSSSEVVPRAQTLWAELRDDLRRDVPPSRPTTPPAHLAGRVTDLVRAAYHPDFHRRSRSSTRSTGRWLRSGRGLSPPVRSYTDPGARVLLPPSVDPSGRDRPVVAVTLGTLPQLLDPGGGVLGAVHS